MHITLEADYAVRIVECLANERRRMDAQRIAEKTDVTLRFSLKILRNLVAAGIICSFKGAKGGYELARPASDITLKEVIETVEGPYVFSRCLAPTHSCLCDSSNCRAASCRFQKVYDQISEEVRRRLEEVTFG